MNPEEEQLKNVPYKNAQTGETNYYSGNVSNFPITSTSLNSVPSVDYETPQGTTVYPVAGLDSTVAPLAPTQPEEDAGDLNKRLQRLNERLVGESTYRAEQENVQGIPELSKTQTDLATRLKTIQNEALAIPLQLQQDATGRGITAAGLAPIQTAALRNNAIQALSTASLLEASRGNLTTALDLVDRAVAQKFDPIKEEIAVKKANLDLILNSPEYSLAEKNRAQAQKDAQEGIEREVQKQEQNQKEIYNIATQAAKNGADPFTLREIQSATTPSEALARSAESGFAVTPQSVSSRSGGASSIIDPSIEYYTQLLAEGKITVSNVPQGIRNAVIAASQGVVNTRLSDTAIKEITQTEKALKDLDVLRGKINENLQFVGPIKGLQKFNPFSKSRQVQADVDRVRQTVGKALEGGVLRKEDEEKYKKILATLLDTPETAIYKIDALLTSLNADIENYKRLQASSGRFVPSQAVKNPEELRTKYSY